MDNLNMIHEFIDGTLDSSKEGELFTMLSGNEEMRTELKQQLAIKSAVRSDINAYAPSSHSTMAVFSALGMGTATAAASAIPLASRLKSVFSRYQQGLMGGLVTAAAMLSIFMLTDFSGNNTVNGDNAGGTSDNTGIAGNNSVPVVINYENDEPDNSLYVAGNENNKQQAKIIYRDKIIYVEKDAPAPEQQNPVNFSSGVAQHPFDYSNIESKNHETVRFIIPEKFNNTFVPDYSLMSPNDNSIEDKMGLSFELKGFESLSESYEKRTASDVQSFNNLNMSLYYSLFNTLDVKALRDVEVGVEYRRENITQSFIYYDESDNQFYKIEQQPNLQSFGLALRWLPSFLSFNDFQPYLQVMMGGNKVGTLYRTGGGFKYAINETYSFVTNLEYSTYNYYHVLKYGNIKQNLSTDKVGVNFGVSVKF